MCAMVLYSSTKNEIFIGNTYDFAEQDLIEAIKQYIKNNKQEIQNKIAKDREKVKNKAINFQPKGMKKLSPAKKDNTFYPDLTYTLKKDISDIKGNIVYQKGFTFNPLKYTRLSYGIVVINGNRKKEIDWLKKSNLINTIAYRIFLSDGNYHTLMNDLKQPVFYCLPQIVERFKLKHTPSIITQIGEKMEVTEICIDCKKGSK